ncbi:hypothetical protein EJB05_38413, partial [Eragrostis curvula]
LNPPLLRSPLRSPRRPVRLAPLTSAPRSPNSASMAGDSLATGQAGPSPSNRKRKATAPSAAAAVEDEGEAEEDIAELEREVADLNRRILEHRRVTGPRALDATASQLAALPPPASLDVSTVSKTSISEKYKDKLEKVKVIESKAKATIVVLPKILEYANDTIARYDRLENLNVNLQPVFRRKG